MMWISSDCNKWWCHPEPITVEDSLCRPDIGHVMTVIQQHCLQSEVFPDWLQDLQLLEILPAYITILTEDTHIMSYDNI